MKNKLLTFLTVIIMASSLNIKATAQDSMEAIGDNLDAAANKIEALAEDANAEIKEVISDAKEDLKATENNPLDDILVLKLKDGDVVIKLLPEVAPKHVARIKELTKDDFYNGIVFHRVIEGFMAQTGDPTGTGTGGSGKNLEAEFTNEVSHKRGTLSMARASNPNSADSQFFIMFDEAPHLDGNYTIFGEVIDGIDFVDGIKKGFGPNGMVSDPDKIVDLSVASELSKDDLPSSVIRMYPNEVGQAIIEKNEDNN